MTLIYNRKTKIILNDPVEFISYLKENFKSFRRLTPELIDRIKNEILVHESIKGTIFEVLKKTLRLGSGSIKPSMMKSLLGWTDDELINHDEYMSKRHIGKLIKLGLSEEEAEIKYAEQQAKNSKRSKEYWINKGYSEEEARIKLKEYQSSTTKIHKESLTDEEYLEFKKKSSKRCKEYWINKGYSEEEANKEIYKLQSKVSKRCKEYWIKLGYTEEDAISAVSDYQKSTMKNKTAKEIEEINKRKANSFGYNHYWDENLENVPGIFYIIKLGDDLHKIGITIKNSVNERYQQKDLNNKEIMLNHICNSIQHAFEIEQLLKRDFSNKIHKDDYGVFGWTEVIHDSYGNIQTKFNHYINNRDEVKQKFRALRKNNENYI